MKERLISLAIWGIVWLAVVGIITLGIVLFGLFVAYILTLMVGNLEMRQAIIPGSVLAAFSMYFCFIIFTHVKEERSRSYLCDECEHNCDDSDQYSTEVFRDFASKTAARAKQAKKKTMRNK